MGHVRPFVETDIPEVARLHGRVHRTGERGARNGHDPYREYFTRVFLEGPWSDPALSSIVYEEDGHVVGFLGVVARRMSMNGQRFRAAIASQWIVDPSSAAAAAVAIQLAKTFLDGPQDLSISDEADDVARKIWEGLGGMTALLHSIYWTRPLRPAQLALSFLRNRASLTPLAAMADAPSRLVDALATRLRHSHLFQTRPELVVDDLRWDTLLDRLPEFTSASSLRVDYDAPICQWLLDRARERKPDGRLYTAVIRNDADALLGWHLYHHGSSGIAEVLQITAKPSSIHQLLDHLFYDAWQRGATAVTGRLEPRFIQAFSDKYCLLHRRGPWLLVDAKKPELLRSFQNGDALFTRFDGEWCLGF
jgi:hypothetical protein